MRYPILAGAAALALAALATAACSGGSGAAPVTPERADAPDRCATPPAVSPRDTITLGFDRTVDAGRAIARQLHDEPAAPDCTGLPRQGDYDLVRTGGDSLVATPRRAELPVLRIRTGAADARDLLDAGADLVMTRDTRAVAYASAREGFVTLPLEWDRVYVLISRARAAVPSLMPAVRGESRLPEPPFWWELTPLCRGDDVNGTGQARRLVVPTGDPVARDLGERVAAVTPGVVVVPADSLSLASALDRGMDAGYILPLPRTAPMQCPTPRWPAGWSAEPLVETHAWLIIRPAGVRVSTDADGLFRVIEPRP